LGNSKQKRIHDQAEGSYDILDDSYEPTIDTEMGQKRSATEVREYFIATVKT
jgi:hypothetical protein